MNFTLGIICISKYHAKIIRFFESGKQDQAVHLPGFSAFFIDGTDAIKSTFERK